MQVVLVMFRADGERRSFSIHRDITVIGRREDCDFRIPLGEVSRKHCRLIKNGEAIKVEDLGSSNGTYCNGLRVQEADLNPGDTLQVGPAVFVVQIDGAPNEDEMAPVTAEAAAAAAAADAVANPSPEVAEVEEAVIEEMGEDVDVEPTTTIASSGATQRGGGGGAKADDNGEFDPMAILEGNDESGVMPTLGDSALGENANQNSGSAAGLDPSEESHQHNA
jgi:pSer/pThr/pTyr-binding forkhead associated (FHA) protein